MTAVRTTVAARYREVFAQDPEITRILGGMTSPSGMVLHMEHAAGEHIIHYHCDRTDGRQHAKHYAVIPAGYKFIGTTEIDGAEYTPREGGRKRADLYERTTTP